MAKLSVAKYRLPPRGRYGCHTNLGAFKRIVPEAGDNARIEIWQN
jgi:hypothetical protein